MYCCYVIYDPFVADKEGESCVEFVTVCPSRQAAESLESKLVWRFLKRMYGEQLQKMKTGPAELVEAPKVREQVGYELFRESRGAKPWSVAGFSFVTKEAAETFRQAQAVLKIMDWENPEPGQVHLIRRQLDRSYAIQFVVVQAEQFQ